MEIIMDEQSQKANNAEPWNDSVRTELEKLQGNELFWYSEAHVSYWTQMGSRRGRNPKSGGNSLSQCRRVVRFKPSGA